MKNQNNSLGTWQKVKIKDIFEVTSGTTPPTQNEDYWKNGKINWLTPADMSSFEGAYIYWTKRKITELAIKDCNLTLMPKKSLIMSTRAPVGYVSIVAEETAFNQGCKGLIPLENKKIETVFFYYYLLNKRKFLESISGGSTFKELTKDSLENLEVDYPELKEQTAIAHILSTVDNQIGNLERERRATERLRGGVMSKLLAGKWPVVELKEIVEVLDNRRVPISEMERNNMKGEYPYCGANGVIDFINKYIFDEELLLLAEDGGDYAPNGKSSYLMKGKFWVNNHAHVLRAKNEKTTNLFLYYILNFLDLRQYIVGSTRTKLNKEEMLKIKINLPSLSEQERITKILQTIDHKLDLEAQRKDKLEKIKRGLMDELLTGKKRINVEKILEAEHE